MNGQNTILIVDDEIKIIEVATSFLEAKGFVVFSAENAKKAFDIFKCQPISLIILDLMLPDMSGEDICKEIRKESNVPIIMLTAKVTEENMLEGLKLGADDYITKPFSLMVLHARIEALLRRTKGILAYDSMENDWSNEDLTINFESHIVKIKEEIINLTPNEFNILTTLIKHPSKVFTRDDLIELALNYEFDGYSRAIDNYIKNLRHKIEKNPKKPIYIQTVHGVGYRFGGYHNENS